MTLTAKSSKSPKPTDSTPFKQAWLARLSLWIYCLILYLALPLVILKAWRRCRKLTHPQLNPKRCWQARFGWLNDTPPPGGIWIHAVSVGETRSIFPLLERLHQQHPSLPITLTSGSTQGALQALEFCPVPIYHQMIPYDYPFAVKRFLKRLQPKLVLMVETEIWPNLYQACHQQAIPLMLINARLKQSSFEAYQRWASPLMRQALHYPQLIGAQFETDQQRFIQLGAPAEKVTVLGNLKFDIQCPTDLNEQATVWRNQLDHPDRFIWVAASTHPHEEELMLKAHQKLLTKHPEALLILVPRHADRFTDVANQMAKAQTKDPILAWQQRSQHALPSSQSRVFLADTMGELMLWFAVSNAAFIGGSMVNFGGHNILEPASLAKPVLSGPYFQNLQSLYDSFISDHGLQVCPTPQALAHTLEQLADSPEQQAYWGQQAFNALQQQTGALSRHYHVIQSYLS